MRFKTLTTISVLAAALIQSAVAGDSQRLTADVNLPEHQSTEQWTNAFMDAAAGDVVGIQRIPVGNLVFVEGQHETYLISEDGRFVFRGGILQDRWAGQNVTDLEAAFTAMRIPLNRYPVDLDNDVATLQLGSAERSQGAIFIDPTTQYSRDLVAEIIESPEKFNVYAVLMPAVGGDAALARSMAIYCAEDREQAIKDLAYNTSESFSNLSADCKREKVPMALMLNSAFRIEGIPHLIRTDGRISAGNPPNLHEWLTKDTR